MTRRWLCLAAVVGLCVLTREGFADDLQGTRFQPSELQHRIRVVLDRGHATLLVERVVFNPGTKSDQAVFSLDLPDGAVATSLKTLGTLRGQPHWFYGDLKEAEVAARTYQEFTGIGGFYPKDPALLSWHSATNLLLQVFPCMPRQNKALGYTLEMPLVYEDGRYRMTLPQLGLEDEAATFTVEAAQPGDRLFVNDRPVETGRVLTASGSKTLALEPYRQFGISGELAVADTGFGRSFAHVRYALASQLSQTPSGAYIVVAIDNSRSMRTDRKDAVRMARQTLRLFPNAQVQILDFNRTPKPRFPGFVPVRTAADALRLELARVQILEDGNGSEVDLALSEAERLLSAVTGVRTKRILLFTDALVPGRISPESITASVGKSGAIVNIVHVNGTKPELFEKNDEHPWSKAARSTGGLVWEPSNADEPGDTNDAKPDPYLALVRPTKLYNAVYSSPSSEEDLGDLGEGSGIERQGLYDVATRWARLSGELWSQPFRLTLYPDAKAGKLWSALVFGTEELSKLSEAEMMVLAQRGGAVSPVTSYLAIEPGVRPSTEGLTLDESSGGLGLMGSGEGSGSGYGAGSGSLGGHRPVDLQAFLEKQLAAKWAKCNGKPGKASVSLDTQYVEVADVRVKVDIPDPGQYDCLNEAAWSLDLRDQQFDEENMAWEIRL